MEKRKYLKKEIILALAIGMATCGNIAMVAGYDAAGGTSAGGNTSIAIGNGATANKYDIAVGNNASASGLLSNAIGSSAEASGVLSNALGMKSTASGASTNAIGYGAKAVGDHANAIGEQATASGQHSNALGFNSQANGVQTTAIGYDAVASADGANAMGSDAKASGGTSTAIGNKSTASGLASNAIGVFSNASGASSNALGGQAKASGKASNAIGLSAKATGDASNAIGDRAVASENGATAIGLGAEATALSANAIGDLSKASGLASNAMGVAANASGESAVALGGQSTASEKSSVAVGVDATSSNINSVALGAYSSTAAAHTGTTAQQTTIQGNTYTYAGLASDANGTVSVGHAGAERQVQNVAAGDITATSTDAVNGSQLYAINEQVNAGWEADVNGTKVKSVTPSSNKLNYVAGKNMTITGSGDDITIATKDDVSFNSVKVGDTVNISNTGIDAGNTKITNVQDGTVSPDSKDAVNGSQLYSVKQDVLNMGDSINNIGGQVNALDKRVDKVGAGAAALAALHPLDFDPDDKWDFAAGYGHYDGRSAYALGLFYRPNEDTMFSVGSTLGNGENLFNAGLSLKFGQGNHVSTTRVAMAREMLDLRADNKAMHEQINAMNERLNNVLGMLDMAKSASFPDVPENHWAYEAVSKLAGNGIVKGYPDGMFKGNQTMTRYEFASMLYRAMQNGAIVDGRLLKEFKPELDRIRVDTVSKHIDRVRVNH